METKDFSRISKLCLIAESRNAEDFNTKVKDVRDGEVYFADGRKHEVTDRMLCFIEDGKWLEWLKEETKFSRHSFIDYVFFVFICRFIRDRR